MLPRQGEMGENTPFTRKCTSEPLETLERVITNVCEQLLAVTGLFVHYSGQHLVTRLKVR